LSASKSEGVVPERLLRKAHAEALEYWDHGDPSEESWASLSRRHQVGIAGGDLYFQIPKSTFQFWIHNGFAEMYQDRLQALLRAVGTITTLVVAKMLDELWIIRGEILRLEEVYEDAVYDEALDDWNPEAPGNPEEARAAQAALSEQVRRCAALDERFMAIKETYADELDRYITSLDGEK